MTKKIQPLVTIAYDANTNEWVAYAHSGDDNPMNGVEIARFIATNRDADDTNDADTIQDLTRMGREIGEELARVYN